jgi:hypothetical protein
MTFRSAHSGVGITKDILVDENIRMTVAALRELGHAGL